MADNKNPLLAKGLKEVYPSDNLLGVNNELATLANQYDNNFVNNLPQGQQDALNSIPNIGNAISKVQEKATKTSQDYQAKMQGIDPYGSAVNKIASLEAVDQASAQQEAILAAQRAMLERGNQADDLNYQNDLNSLAVQKLQLQNALTGKAIGIDPKEGLHRIKNYQSSMTKDIEEAQRANEIQARISLLEGKAQELGMRYGQQKANNALNMLKQEMAEDNLMKSKAEASEQLYNALLQQSSDDRYKGLIDNQATVDLSKKPIETDFLPSVYHGFVDSVADIPRGLGAIINAIALSPEEKQQRLEALKNLTSENAPTNWLGDSLIKLGDRMSDSDIDYQNKYNLDNMLLDADSAKGAINTALGIGKNAAGIVADTLVSAAPEILTTAISTGTIPTALRTAKIAARTGQIAEDVGAGLAKVSNVATKLEKPVANWSSVATGEATKATKFTADKFSLEVFRTNLSGYVSEETAKKVASKLGANATPSMAGKTLRETLTKAEKLELAKVSWVKDSAKLFGGITGLSAEVTQKMHNAQIDRMKQQGIDPDKLGYLVSLNKNDIIPAMAYTALNLVEFGTLFKPLIGNKLTSSLISSIKDKSFSGVFNGVKDVAKSLIGDRGVTAAAVLASAGKLIGNSAMEGATEYAQTITEAMMRDNDLKGSLGDYYDAVRNVLANPKSYKEVKEAGITGAIAGAGTHVTGQIAPSVARESLSKVTSLAGKGVNKISEYVTANKVQAQENINNVSNLNAKAENKKDVSLKELYQVAISPKAREAFLNEPDTDNNKEYKALVEDLANLDTKADTATLANELSQKYPKYTQEQLADIIHISKNKDTKYSDADISKLSQPIREAIESVDQESYDNSKVKAMLQNKSYEDLTLGERYAIAPSKPVEQQSTESKPDVRVTKDHRLATSLEGVKDNTNEANTYVAPVEVETGNIKKVTSDDVDSFNRVFSEKNLTDTKGNYKSEKDVRKAYRSFVTTLAIAEATDTTKASSIKDTYIGGLVNKIRQDILLVEDPVNAYRSLDENSIERKLVDLILEDVNSQSRTTTDDGVEHVNIVSPLVNMLTNSDIEKPEDKEIDTEKLGTQGVVTSSEGIARNAIDGLEKLFDSAYGGDKKTRKLRNINKMTALGVTASKASEAIKKFKYVIALREAAKDTVNAVDTKDIKVPIISTESLVSKVLEAQQEIQISQKQTQSKLDVVNKFFGKEGVEIATALKAFGAKLGENTSIESYIHPAGKVSGLSTPALVIKIDQHTGETYLVPGDTQIKDISGYNQLNGRDRYLLYIPVKTTGKQIYTLANTTFVVSDNADATGSISLVDNLKKEVKELDEASKNLQDYVDAGLPQIKRYLDETTLKLQDKLNQSLVTMINGVKKLSDTSVRESIKDTLGRLNRVNKDVRKLELYIERIKKDKDYFGDADNTVKVEGSEVSLSAVSLVKAKDLLSSLLAERDTMLYNMQIFFNGQKDASNIIALIGLWNTNKLDKNFLNPYMDDSLTAKAKSLIRSIANFFTGADAAIRKFKALLEQVNATRSKKDQITINDIERLSKIVIDTKKNLTNQERYEIADTAFRVIGVLSTQSERRYGFGEENNLLSELLPSADVIAANRDTVNLSNNLIGGYYLPNAQRLSSYAIFDKSFDLNNYNVAKAFEFEDFKNAIKIAISDNAFTLDHNDLFTDLFKIEKVSNTIDNTNSTKDKAMDLKEAVTRSMFMSIMGMLASEKLIAPLAKISSNLADTEENQQVTSTYQATIIVNDLLRNFGLVEANPHRTAGQMAEVTEQLKNMFQKILKDSFAKTSFKNVVAIDPKTNVIKLLDKTYLPTIQKQAKAFTDRGYIAPKEVAAKEQLSDVLKDLRLSQKGNKLSTETDPRVRDGIIAQTLTPLEYNLTKMNAMVAYLSKNGKNLASEVVSMLNPITTSSDIYSTGKITISENLWNTQVKPIVTQAAVLLGADINQYVEEFKNEVIKIDDKLKDNPAAEALLASTDIPLFNNKIQSFIEVIQESKSDRGKGTQFYYNVFAGPNDRTTIDGTGHQQSNKNIRHLIKKVRDPKRAKELFNKEFETYIYNGKDLKEAKEKSTQSLLLALGTNLGLIDYAKIANGEYREEIAKLHQEYADKMLGMSSLEDKKALLKEKQEKIQAILLKDQLAYEEFVSATLDLENGELAKIAFAMLENTTHLATLDEKLSHLREVMPEFKNIPTYNLLDALEAIQGLNTISLSTTISEVRDALYDSLYALETLETDGQTFGPASINILNFVERASRKLALAGNLSISEDPLMYMDDDNYNFTAQMLFSEWFRPILGMSLRDIVSEQGLSEKLDNAEGLAKVIVAKEALINELMNNVKEYETDPQKQLSYRNLLDLVVSEAIFKFKQPEAELSTMLDKSMMDTLNARIKFIRVLSKPILQLSGYGSGVKNNTKGFLNSFFMKDIPAMYAKATSLTLTNAEKKSKVNLFNSDNTLANEKLAGILTPSEVASLRILGVRNLEDLHNLITQKENGELDFTNLNTASSSAAETLIGVVTQALQRVSPFQAQRTNVVMSVLNDHIRHLAVEINKKLGGNRVTYVEGKSEKAGSIDYTDVSEKDFLEAVKAVQKENSTLVGILMSAENGSITNFVRRTTEAVEEKSSNNTPIGTRSKKTRVYFSPVDLSLVTNFGQSIDAKVQGIVQSNLAEMGIFVGLNNFDAFTTSAPFIRLVSQLANEAFAELIMDDKANLSKTMLEAAIENEKEWIATEKNPEVRNALAATIARTESYLLGLEVAKDLRTVNGVQVDNFGGNYRLDMNRKPATEVIIKPNPNTKEYEEAIARLYPIDGSSTQKAMEFYTTLVPTLEWLNAYSDLYFNPRSVVHLIKELLKKQAQLGERYINADTLESTNKALEVIEEFLTKNSGFKDAKEFYKYVASKLLYQHFKAFEKLQDTFYTKNPTQRITLAKEEFRNNPALRAAEYGRYFAQKQNSLVTNSMIAVDKKVVNPSIQSNLYTTNLNRARNDELAIHQLDYSTESGYTLDGFPINDTDNLPILDGEVYSVTPTAYKQLKDEVSEAPIKQILADLSRIRGIQVNNIVINPKNYKKEIEAKATNNGEISATSLKNVLKDNLLGKLSSNNFKDVLEALHLASYLKANPSLFGNSFVSAVNDILADIDSELSDPHNSFLLPDSTTKKSVIAEKNRQDANVLLKYLQDNIVPDTMFRGYSQIDESLGNDISITDFTETLNDTIPEEATNTEGTDVSDLKVHTQSADTTEESIRKGLYKEITLENSFESLVDTFNELSDMSGLDAEHKNMYVALLNRFFTKTNGDRFFRDGLEIRVFNSTGETNGNFDPRTNKIEIFLGDQRTSIGLSPAEAYMHELIHAVTEYAIQSEEPEAIAIVKNAEGIRRELMRYYNSNQAKLDLANRLGFTGTDAHKIDSVSRIYIDYMNGSISEFITIAMTNKEVQNDLAKLKHKEARGFIERLVRFFSRLLNALTNTPQEIDLEHNSGSQAVYQLAVRLANNNNQLQSVYKDLKYKSTLQKWLGVADSLTNKTVSQWIKNEATKLEAGNPAKNIYSLAKYLMFAPRNPVIAHKAMKLLVNDFDFSPNGFLATTLSNISTLDDAKRKVNELLAKSANLDKERLMLHTSLQKELKSKFSRDLTPTESKELGKIVQVYDLRAIDNDINRLYPTYFAGKTNSQTRDRIRAEIRETLSDLSQNMSNYLVSGNNNRIASILAYYNEKTQELADYISKGQISSNMLLNAYNIAQGLTLPDIVDNRLKNKNEIINQKKVSELAQKLDKLISLRALVNASDKTLSTFRELYESDLTNAGVVNAFDMHKMSKQGLEDELLTKGVISNEVKGYVRTRTNESVDIIVAPIAEEADLKADGYKLVKNYAKVFNFGGRGLGMYISTTNMQPKFNRGVIRTTSNSSRGMTIQSAVNNMYPLETTAKKQAIVADLISKLKRDNRNQSEEFVPVFDAKGQIVDYRLLLSQKQKEELEIANTDLFDTLPNAITRYVDRVQSEAHNKEILKDLEEYYHKNKGKEEFIYLGPDGIKAHNPRVKKESDLVQLQEIWDLIPGTTKDYIQDSLQGMDQGIYVQASQFASIAGSRDFRLTDTDAFKRIVPITYFRRLAKMMEYGIIKMGKWVTQKIVLTNPDVIIGNLASNQLVLTTFGLDPVTSMKYYAEGIQYIQAYNYLKEKEVLLKKDMELATDPRKKAIAEDKLTKLRNKMKSNPIYKFDKKGLISDIAEDLPKTEEQQDFIDRAIEKSLNKVGVPQAFREAFDVVMVNEGTTLHSAYASLVKYSDLVARYALYKHMKLTDNLTDQDMFDLLDRAFINYTPAQHPILKYANDIGFARFTKYWLRVQSHISTDLLDKRLGSTMLLHGALKLMGVPISSPLNAIFFRKFMNYDTTFGIPGVTDIDEIYDDLADGLIITNPLVALKKLF
jgi:N4 gp50-like protein